MITATATTCYDPSSIMKPLLSIRGELHAPYFIFLRCANKYSDLEILRQFMLLKYRPTAFQQTDALHITLQVAESLGIRTRYLPSEVRVYAAPTPNRILAAIKRAGRSLRG